MLHLRIVLSPFSFQYPNYPLNISYSYNLTINQLEQKKHTTNLPPLTACFLGALQLVASKAGKKELAANAKIHTYVHLGTPEGMPGFGVNVDIKVEGVPDEGLIHAAHEVSYQLMFCFFFVIVSVFVSPPTLKWFAQHNGTFFYDMNSIFDCFRCVYLCVRKLNTVGWCC